MVRSMDSRKAAQWRRRLKRYERSRETVARFCEEEGCSVPSFYAWRKKLAEAESGMAGRGAQSAGPFRPVTVTAAAPVSIRLAGGARIEVAGADVKLVRAVVREVVQADRAGEGGPPC